MIKVLGLAILAAINVSACDPQPVRVDVAEAPESIPASHSPEIITSIENSLRYLTEEGDRWMEGKVWVQPGEGCVSCHHVGYALWSHREAERAGIQLVDSGIADLRRRDIHPYRLRVTGPIVFGKGIGVEILGGQETDAHA